MTRFSFLEFRILFLNQADLVGCHNSKDFHSGIHCLCYWQFVLALFLCVNVWFFFVMPLFHDQVFFLDFLILCLNQDDLVGCHISVPIWHTLFVLMTICSCLFSPASCMLMPVFSSICHCFITRFSFLDFFILCLNQADLVGCHLLKRSYF